MKMVFWAEQSVHMIINGHISAVSARRGSTVFYSCLSLALNRICFLPLPMFTHTHTQLLHFLGRKTNNQIEKEGEYPASLMMVLCYNTSGVKVFIIRYQEYMRRGKATLCIGVCKHPLKSTEVNLCNTLKTWEWPGDEVR